jgi:hypothetical protein
MVNKIRGISIKNSSTYLGFSYNRNLNIDYSIKILNNKLKFIHHKLYHVLKKVNFRIRIFLWRIIIWPNLMMLLSLSGPSYSLNASIIIDKVLKVSCLSLKKFCLAPKYANVNIF